MITAHAADDPFGITATSVTSVSLDPPSLLVCVNRSARLHAAIGTAGHFRVNYLACGQQEVARAFGTNTGMDRFGAGSWRMHASHGPELVDALAQMTCRLESAIDHGTHTIFIGGIDTVQPGQGAPLLYCGGDYAMLAARCP